ncbi:hypothetical protein [Trinickia diaoshuihuensis]|uniref:hypothetical protein n=1 Tax=Trinickia diaoshuihuensis TaxID=2292265 RepID=UPI000E254A1A|nr:hypothetical protein [Trinickia diaoshuihuensis]
MFRPFAIITARAFTVGTLIALFCTAPCAFADDVFPIFTLSGFGTLGATYSSLHTADYTGGPFEPNGAGASRHIDFAGDSRLGLQLSAKFTNKFSALIQVVSQENYDNSFTPKLEWANLDYGFTPDINLRAGRIELPTFLTSDCREVGYANPWVRVPPELYDVQPITSSDGVDASYRVHIGAVTNTVHVIYGESVFHVAPGPLRTQGTGIFGVFDTAEYRALTAHLGYLRAHVTVPFASDLPVTVYSAAASLDMERWFLQGEVARATVDGLTPGYIAGYATAGLRLGKFTPYLTYAVEHSLDRPVLSPNLNTGQRGASAGLRWDFAKNLDLKVQYDRVWTPAGSTGLFMNEQPDFQLGSGTDVVTATLDFVF